MFQKITPDLLDQLSQETTYFRGENYFERGAVRKIKCQNDQITATVKGSRTYTVTITNVSKKPEFWCTCPYDRGGICKHSIAVALTLINHPDVVEIVNTVEPEKEPRVDLDMLFKTATADQKTNFLMEILKNDRVYREKFRTLVHGQVGVESNVSVEEIQKSVKTQLESFDLVYYERFYDYYDSEHGFREEWEILSQGARKELSEIIGKYTESITEYLNAENIIDAAKHLLGVYEGILFMDEEKIEDPVSILADGLCDECLYIFFNYVERFVERFRVLDKKEDAIIRISEIIVERMHIYQQSSAESDTFDYIQPAFKPFLVELVSSTRTAQYWDSVLKKSDLDNTTLVEIQLKIAEQLNDDKNWLAVAEKGFKSNPVVARKLLDLYKEKGDKENFIRVGKFALTSWPRNFYRYLYENTKKEDDPDFYANVLLEYAEQEESIPVYREYKEKYGREAARKFIEMVKDDLENDLFYIRLLEEEKDFPAILNFVENNVDSWDFIDLIKPIINVYPAECVKIICAKTTNFLHECVGRKYYYHAARWLKLLLNIKDKEIREQVQRYFNALFKTYNNRPALKDELRKVGINPG